MGFFSSLFGFSNRKRKSKLRRKRVSSNAQCLDELRNSAIDTGNIGRCGRSVDISANATYAIDVVGESFYQENIEILSGGRKEKSVAIDAIASLIYENENPYDSLAIRIDISGLTVGYLNKIDARRYRQELKHSGLEYVTLKCPALIVGGWDRGDNDRGYFGVKLDIPYAGQ